MDYEVVKRLPVSERREMLEMLLEENEKHNDAVEEARNNSKSGGKNTLSGDKLKNFIQQNGNPT